SSAVAVLLIAANIVGFAQTAAKAFVSERNVRAQMGFLAGDALQGRGSGTIFERIAAEYIGSQFMQFGLEPAGETGADGKQTYVQTVDISRQTFAEAPTLKFYDKTLVHGQEMIILRTNTAAASGGLHLIVAGQTPRSGATVILRAKEGEDQRALMQSAQKLQAAGAAIVLIEETPAIRANWANFASRMPSFTTTNAKPAVMAVINKATADQLSGEADGLVIRLGGKLEPVKKQQTWNAMGKITGSDKTLGSEVILLTSHLDHLGVRENAPGDDKIFNGADDDASGSVAVLELARVIAAGKKPKRTVYFVCFGSEEAGGFGASYFVNNMPFPKDKLVANLEFEMIGRPDAKVKAEELWLTGYERSNLGPELAKRGAKLVQDPHPTENFFQRSDNYTLARQGIIAHTVSSFGLHTDYHKASDEAKTIDFVHMTRSINSMVAPVQWLINSPFKPVWNEGMKP
ncbi:MAG: M20/M25/M40 family metallo-hydrolase, partial [Pyrinomonadaceae bacterium]|nr:M20/M25/M40 family metallo-hydrolase [Pyrinomonadaceae bacterium]